MAGKKCKGSPLKIFSGKQAKLNRIVTLLCRSSKTPLTKYDIYKQIHNMKGYKHYHSRTVYRRINALIGEGLIAKVGSLPGQVEGESVLYELTRKGKASLKGDEKSIEQFLQTATEENYRDFLTYGKPKICGNVLPATADKEIPPKYVLKLKTNV